MNERIEHPLLYHPGASSDVRARNLIFAPCSKRHAVALTRQWHSRLPNVQRGPWMFAFSGEIDAVTYVVALWNNPSARGLPNNWLELRRLACSPDAPKNTPSAFLSFMAKWFRKERPKIVRLISYQDTAVHDGTIYRAAGWQVGDIAKARIRDRTKNRVGTQRAYRSNINGLDADGSEKARWEYPLHRRKRDRATKARNMLSEE